MLFAMLAKLLLGRPPLVQAAVLGLCTGLFVSALAQANDRDPALDRTAVLVLGWGGAAAAGYYLGLHAMSRATDGEDSGRPWVARLHAAVWVVGLLAAAWALLGDGGLEVAALAIVPLALLTPSALVGVRSLVRPAAAAS